MKFLTKCVMAAAVLAAITGANASAQEIPVYKGNSFQCCLYDKYTKNSGLIQLTLPGKKTLLRNNYIHAQFKNEKGKRVGALEKSSAKYEWKNNVLSSEKFVCLRNDKAPKPVQYAKVTRKITFSPDGIKSSIRVKNLRDVTIANTWTSYNEIMFIPVVTVAGMRLDGELLNGEKITALIPRKYSRNKWGFRKYVRTFTLTGQDESKITFTADPNSKLLLNHYGGKNIELIIVSNLRDTERLQKKGRETVFSYTIQFNKK